MESLSPEDVVHIEGVLSQAVQQLEKQGCSANGSNELVVRPVSLWVNVTWNVDHVQSQQLLMHCP